MNLKSEIGQKKADTQSLFSALSVYSVPSVLNPFLFEVDRNPQ